MSVRFDPKADFQLAGCLVQPSTNDISRGAIRITVEPKVMDLLVTFVENPERVFTRDELIERVAHAVGGSVHLCPGGPERIRSVGVVTGGAGSEVADAAANGVDAFVTGEGPHWSYPLAEELGINLVYAGHYATETFGVKSLAAALSEEFQVTWEFVDHPTGL